MNPISVNSSNLSAFGFSAVFKFFEKKITLDISGLTQFIGGGASSVIGVFFEITDPSGIDIINVGTTPAIDPSATSTLDVDIPNLAFAFGWWQIKGIMRDSDGTDYTINLTKNICQPKLLNPKGYIDGSMAILVDCYSPAITISEETVLVYNDKKPSSVTKDGNLFYPQGTLSEVDFNFTPFKISGNGDVYTGKYLIKNTTTADYDLDDHVFVELKYFTNKYFDVDCNSSLSSIMCCISDVKDILDKHPDTERGLDAKTKLDRASIPLFVALTKERLGQRAYEEVKEIRDILDCDCNCVPALIEPSIVGSGSGSGNDIVVSGAGAVSVTVSSSGSTTNYLVSAKTVQVTKDVSETGFSIQKVESTYGTIYKLTINYDALSENILNIIKGSDELTTLLQSIIGGVNGGVDLSGLNTSCVAELTNCSYSLIEPTNSIKTVISITIAGVVYNAPTGLLLTNTAGISSWLNGLSKGTFVVSADSGAGTVTISSANNANLITQFIMTAGGVALNRQFSRSCIGLVQFLNAITDYICDLDATQVKFGRNGKTICSFDSQGNPVATPIDPDIFVDELLSQILAQQCVLFNKINGILSTCASFKQAFSISTATLLDTDGLFGLKGDGCARILFPDLAGILLTKIGAVSALRDQFCALVALCSAPTCSAPTNVSAVFTAGAICSPITNLTGSVS